MPPFARQETCWSLKGWDSSVNILSDAAESADELVGKRCEKVSSGAALRVLAREKECSSKSTFDGCLLVRFQGSHSFNYSERNSGLPDACGVMQPNQLTLLLFV
jgi:hypothetical protein